MLKLSNTYRKSLIKTVFTAIGMMASFCLLYYISFYILGYAQNSEKPFFFLVLMLSGTFILFVTEITSEYNKIKKVYDCTQGKDIEKMFKDIDSGADFIQSMIDNAIEVKSSLLNENLSFHEKQELAFSVISPHEVNKNNMESIIGGVQRFIDIQKNIIDTFQTIKEKLMKGEGLSKYELHILWENCIFDD